MNVSCEPLKQSDIGELVDVMTRAFDDDAKNFLGKEKSGPPGYDDGSFLEKWGIDNLDSFAIKVSVDGAAVGAFILWWNEEGDSTLGNIFIDPDYQNMGVGKKVWTFIEMTFPTRKWRLETPKWATRNHHFYQNSCGFIRVGEVEDQIVYEKTI